jgi:hypothetical protein
MATTTAKAMVFSIPRIWPAHRPFSSPEACHNETDWLSKQAHYETHNAAKLNVAGGVGINPDIAIPR